MKQLEEHMIARQLVIDFKKYSLFPPEELTFAHQTPRQPSLEYDIHESGLIALCNLECMIHKGQTKNYYCYSCRKLGCGKCKETCDKSHNCATLPQFALRTIPNHTHPSALKGLLNESTKAIRRLQDDIYSCEKQLVGLTSLYFPGVDIQGKLESIERKLEQGVYSEYSVIPNTNMRNIITVIVKLCCLKEKFAVLEFAKSYREVFESLHPSSSSKITLSDNERILFALISLVVMMEQLNKTNVPSPDNTEPCQHNRNVETPEQGEASKKQDLTRFQQQHEHTGCLEDFDDVYHSNITNLVENYNQFVDDYLDNYVAMERIRETGRIGGTGVYYCLLNEIHLFNSLKPMISSSLSSQLPHSSSPLDPTPTNHFIVDNKYLKVEFIKRLDIIGGEFTNVSCSMSETGVFAFYDSFFHSLYIVDLVGTSSTVLGCFPTGTSIAFRKEEIFLFSHHSHSIHHCNVRDLFTLNSDRYSSAVKCILPRCLNVLEDTNGVYFICDTSLASVYGVVYKTSLRNTVDEVDLDGLEIRTIYTEQSTEHLCSILSTTGMRLEGIQCLFFSLRTPQYGSGNYRWTEQDGKYKSKYKKHPVNPFGLFSLGIDGTKTFIGDIEGVPMVLLPDSKTPSDIKKGIIIGKKKTIHHFNDESKMWSSSDGSGRKRMKMENFCGIQPLVRIVNDLFVLFDNQAKDWFLVRINRK